MPENNEAPERTAADKTGDPEPKKVLIIDDDRSYAAMVRFLLQGEGLTVFIAQDGESGLQELSTINPDLVILDVNMPGLNGFKVCEIIRARDDTKNTPVIFLSSQDSVGDFDQAYSLEAVEYLVKTTDPQQLVKLVRKALPKAGVTN